LRLHFPFMQLGHLAVTTRAKRVSGFCVKQLLTAIELASLPCVFPYFSMFSALLVLVLLFLLMLLPP